MWMFIFSSWGRKRRKKGKLKKGIDAFEGKPEKEGKWKQIRERREWKGRQGVRLSQAYSTLAVYLTMFFKNFKFVLANQLTTFYPIYNPNSKITVALPKKLWLKEVCSRQNYRQVAFIDIIIFYQEVLANVSSHVPFFSSKGKASSKTSSW